MGKRASFEDKLARLAAVDAGRLRDEDCEAIRQALEGTEGFLAGKAARLAREARLSDLAPLFAQAFMRFLDKPDRDKGCVAKIAIVEALNEWEYGEADVFLRGARHVQWERVWGPPVDTAQELRGPCAAGLARLRHPEALFELTGLLMDGQLPPQRAAVRILAALGREEGELLLRMKALGEGCAPEVLGDCLEGLMRLAPGRSLPFVAGYLAHADSQVSEAAETALGESRDGRALACLIERRESMVEAEGRRRLLLAIGLSRREEAFDYLLGALEEENESAALAALEALALFGGEASKRLRVGRATQARDSGALREAWARLFPCL